jgi:hypothetical protein
MRMQLEFSASVVNSTVVNEIGKWFVFLVYVEVL